MIEDKKLEAERSTATVSSILKRTILERRVQSWILPSKTAGLCVQGSNKLALSKERPQRPRQGGCRSMGPTERSEVVEKQSLWSQDYQDGDGTSTDMMSALLDYWRQKAENPEAEETRLSRQESRPMREQQQLMEGKVMNGTNDPKHCCFIGKDRENLPKREGQPSKAKRKKLIIKVVLPNIKDDIC